MLDAAPAAGQQHRDRPRRELDLPRFSPGSFFKAAQVFDPELIVTFTEQIRPADR